MGNFISLLNISEDNDNGYIPYTTTLTKYQDHTGNYQNFEQGQKYFFRYIITHNDTQQKVTKTYPIPFEIDSVLGVTDFNIRIKVESFNGLIHRYMGYIENLTYTHEKYRNTQLNATIRVKYFNDQYTNAYNRIDRWNLLQNFDSNNKINSQYVPFPVGYLNKFFTIEITFYDPASPNVVLFTKETLPRVFIPIIYFPAGEQVTIYPTRPGGII